MDARTNNCKRYCSYNGCSSDSITTNKGAISFFSFPKDTERCSKWITNSGREEFRYFNPRELSKRRICELHFAPCMFSNEFKTNLKKYAFPMNWKNAVPELIEIVDDDDEDNLYEEHTFVDEIESVDLVENGNNEEEVSDDGGQNEQNNVIANSVSTNNLDNGITNIEATRNTPQESQPDEVVLNPNDSEPTEEESHSVSAVTSTSNTTVEESSKKSADKSPSKSNPPPTEKTKFHNLPTQTTQGEFYYQQCPSVEETNHTYPEPPDGEMPLFVQQNSVASAAEESANSESSEPVAKRRKVDKVVELSAQMKDAMKYLKDITELLTTSEDEFELFGKSVALQLKKMSLCTALTVQSKIQQVLSQYRINDIKKKSQRDQDGSIVQVNGIEDDKSEGEPEESVEKQTSPQLLLDCTSETSDNEEK